MNNVGDPPNRSDPNGDRILPRTFEGTNHSLATVGRWTWFYQYFNNGKTKQKNSKCNAFLGFMITFFTSNGFAWLKSGIIWCPFWVEGGYNTKKCMIRSVLRTLKRGINWMPLLSEMRTGHWNGHVEVKRFHLDALIWQKSFCFCQISIC